MALARRAVFHSRGQVFAGDMHRGHCSSAPSNPSRIPRRMDRTAGLSSGELFARRARRGSGRRRRLCRRYRHGESLHSPREWWWPNFLAHSWLDSHPHRRHQRVSARPATFHLRQRHQSHHPCCKQYLYRSHHHRTGRRARPFHHPQWRRPQHTWRFLGRASIHSPRCSSTTRGRPRPWARAARLRWRPTITLPARPHRCSRSGAGGRSACGIAPVGG